ncbi:MAG: PilZ domain-containing protein [Sphingomonadaceae bacterium]|nr:PilZ domain-containing protein [Sphingomonadaceae bacterium]
MAAIDISRSEAGHARREQRFPVDLAAIVRGGAADLPVRLKDLSRHGALGHCLCPPPALSRVTLVRGELQIEARVAWAGRGRFGLEFAKPIRATQLLVQLSLNRASPA